MKNMNKKIRITAVAFTILAIITGVVSARTFMGNEENKENRTHEILAQPDFHLSPLYIEIREMQSGVTHENHSQIQLRKF